MPGNGDFEARGRIIVDADINSVLGGVKQLQGAFNGLKLPSNLTANMTKDFDKLREVLTKMRDLSGKQSFSKGDVKAFDKLQSQANSLFSSIENGYNEISGKQIYLDVDATKIKEAQSEIDKLKADVQSKLSNIKLNLSTQGGGEKAFGLEGIISGMEKGVKSSKVLSSAMQEVRKSLQVGDFSGAVKIFGEIEQKAETLKGASTGLLDLFKQMGLIDFSSPASSLAKTEDGVTLLRKGFDELTKKFPESSAEIQKLAKELDVATQKKAELEATAKANIAEEMNKGAQAARDYGDAADQAAQSTKKMAESSAEAANQIKQLQQSTQYFFGLRNMINLLKRGVREAVDTVRDLDKAMTETAVVTNFSVGDMWKKLPEYTANANKLGATVQDMYEATTLYYQQGLDTNQAMSVANETMKMARIGGLEAADATDKMTAALRGFNMEINEASAQRVNDVYSNLAAKTASNTEELGTAMQRTASIANSAGSSFEGTAAFLAQAIETTREPAENIGTAMKTIVARFQEMKKNPLQISEVEGEEVDYNKIDAALKSIGVDLKDTNGQFRNFDEVMLDISKNWNNLTQTQQRYVATTAAGSRQQSRFIAMVSNYDRTMQLMGYANDSAGASQEQFNKTLDSFEAKVNKLQNAWKGFLMGITDNGMIKGAIDGLTGIITVVNDLINKLSFGLGPVKSFLSLMTAFTGLKMGGRILNSVIGGLGGLVDPTSTFMGGFKSGAISRNAGNPTLASQIYTPIVAAIHGLKAVENGKNPYITNESLRYDLFKSARGGINDVRKNGGIVNDVVSQLNGLDAKSQKTLVNGFRNTFMTAEKAILSSYTKYNIRTHEAAGVNSPFRKSLINQENKEIEAGLNAAHAIMRQDLDAGRILPQKYFENLNNPQVVKQALDAANKNSGGRYNAAVAFMDNFNKTIDDKVKNRTTATMAHPNFKKLTEEQQTAVINKLKSDTTQKYMRTAITKEMLGSGQEEVKVPTFGKIADGIGQIGSAATSAGYGLQSFGSILERSAIPGVSTLGSVLTDFGSMVSTVGMAISGLSGAISAVVGAIGAIPAAIALAIGVVVAGAYIYKKVQEKQIRDKAEKITNDYKEKSDKVTSNINNLQQWKEELPRLSKGVDNNGNNINLENSDYQHYLEIVDKIAELNPEIVKGYNAQGHAIIDNNTALEETLKLQKELQENALKEYTSDESLKALVAARDLEKTTAYDANYNWRRVGTSKALKEQRQSVEVFKPQATMAEQGRSMAQILMQAGIESKQFKDLGINLESLEAGEQSAVSALERHFDKFITRSKSLMEDAAVEVSDSTKKTFDKATEGFQKAAGEMDELVTPVYEALSARLSQEKVFQNIPDEIRTYFNQGLKDIASDANLSSNQMISASRRLSNEFANLTEDGSKYSKVMDEVAKAQDKFGEDLDAKAYKETADEAVESLERIKKGIDSTTGYGQALTEFLDNQIAKIVNFTQEGEANIAEALNTMTDEIAAAEGALESFKKVEEGSNFGTAAENMKQIYDAVTTGEDGKVNKHQAGKNGDQTYWKAAETLFGREELKKASKQDVDKMLKNIEPLLQEGEAGWKAFTERWKKAYDAGKFGTQGNEKIEGLSLYKSGWFSNINTDVNPDAYKQIADALDMSEDMLVSMLNKGRQFADINFTNFKELRKGFATSDSVIQGTGGGKKKNLYIKEDTLNAELAAGGITGVKEQEEYKSKLATEQNIKVITQAAKIGMDEFVDMGINTQKSLIAVLGDTGQYSKEEIQEYAERYAKLNNEAFDKAQYKEDWKHYEAASDPIQGEQLSELESLDTTVMAILHSMQSQEVTNGTLADFKGKDLLESIQGDTKKKGDTKLEAFGQGFSLGKNGESHILKPKEYEKNKKEFEDTITENKEYIKQLKIGKNAAKAAGDTEQVEKYDQEIKDVKKANKLIQAALDSALINMVESKAGALSGLGFLQNTGGRVLPFNATNNLDAENMEVQDALQRVYKAAFKPNSKLTQSLLEDMQLLGIDVEQAIKDGLIVDPKGIYEKAKEEGEKGQEAAEQGRTEGEKKGKGKTPKTETEEPEETGGASETKKPTPVEPRESTAPVNQYTSAELAKYTSGSFFSNMSKWWKKVTSESNTSTETGTQKKTESTTTIPGVGQVDKNGKVVSKSADDAANSLDGVGKEAEAASGGLKEFAGFISSLFGGQSKEKQPSFTTIPGVGRVDRSGKVISGNEGNKGGTNTGGTPQVESQTATLTIDADYAQVTEAKTEVQSTINLAKRGATLNIKGSKSGGLLQGIQQKMASAQKAISGVKGNKVSITADVNGKKDVTDLSKAIKEVPKKFISHVTASVSGLPSLESLRSKITNLPSQKIINIIQWFKKKGKKDKSVGGDDNWRGQNNTGHVPSIPSGSLATGSSKPGIGRIGPKGKGGLTLTGELGYEVAWLPREHRSMILGVHGPEMVNLPGDAVVWNHEQSKQIVKKNAIPSGSAWIGAGSMGGDSDGTTNSEDVFSNNTPKKPGKTIKNKNKNKGKNKGKDKDDKNRKATSKNIKAAAKIITKAGKISTWWENISKKVSTAERLANKNQKTFEKELKRVGATIDSIQEYSDEYSKYLQKQVTLNQEIVNKYTKDLNKLITNGGKNRKGQEKYPSSKGSKVVKANIKEEELTRAKAAYEAAKKTKGKKDDKKAKSAYEKAKKAAEEARENIIDPEGKIDKAESKVRNAEKALKKARKTKSKKDDKKAKAKLSKAKKNLKKVKSDAKKDNPSIKTVSYEDTVKVTTKKGGKKKTTKQKIKTKRSVDFSKILYEDEDGNILVDQNAVNKAAGGNKKAAQAIKEKAIKLADEKQKRRDEAQDKIDAANEALQQLGEQIYDEFYGWKNELTKIWKITQKIAENEKKREALEGGRDLISAMLKSGMAQSTEALASMTTKYINGIAQTYALNVKNASDALSQLQEDFIRARDLPEVQGWQTQQQAILAPYLNDKGEIKSNLSAEDNEKAQIAQGKLNKINAKIAAKEEASKYFKPIIDKASGLVTIEFDAQKLDEDYLSGDMTTTTYEAIKEYIDNLQSIVDSIYEQINAQIQYLTQLYTLLREIKEQYADYADDLLQAYEDIKQSEVDNLEKIYDSLNNSLKDLLDQVKNSLEKRRQAEDNSKTEKDINQKQQRLALLRANTAGGNKVEIAQLEKEIADAQQSYGRTLEDQLLSKLEEQADLAAKQREQQIKLLNAQLQIAHTTGENARHIDSLMAGITAGNQEAIAQAQELYRISNDYYAKPTARQVILDADFQEEINNIRDYTKRVSDIESKIDAVKGYIDQLEEQLAAILEELQNEYNEELGDKQTAEIQVDTSQLYDNSKLDAQKIANDEKIELLKAERNRIHALRVKNVEAYQQDKNGNRSTYITKDKQYSAQLSEIDKEIKALEQSNQAIEEIKKNQVTKQEVSIPLDNIKAILNSQNIEVDENFKGLQDLSQEDLEKLGQLDIDMIRVIGNMNLAQAASFKDVISALGNLHLNPKIIVNSDGTVSYTEEGMEEPSKPYGADESGLGNLPKPGSEPELPEEPLTPFLDTLTKYNSFLEARGSENSNSQYRGQLGKTGLEQQLERGRALNYEDSKVLQDLADTKMLSWGKVIETYLKIKSKKETAKMLKSYFENNGGATSARKKGWKEAFGKDYPEYYAAGGMNYTTGPAWLDGTRAKPEAVLSATDTKNFIQLRDVLSSLMNGVSSISSNVQSGQVTYDIDINVDHIASDYDVDRIATRIEQKIVHDASYRNVNVVRNLR